MKKGKKFVTGVLLIIVNFIIGKIAIPLFAVNSVIGITLYLLSWFMLIVGLFLCGIEGLHYAKIYYRQLG